MQTGGIALCSAKRKLNRTEAVGWSSMLRSVADDIDAFLETGTFLLDDRGQPMVKSTLSRSTGPMSVMDTPRSDEMAPPRTATGRANFTGECHHAQDPDLNPSDRQDSGKNHDINCPATKAIQNEIATTTVEPPRQAASPNKAGGLRVAKRKT